MDIGDSGSEGFAYMMGSLMLAGWTTCSLRYHFIISTCYIRQHLSITDQIQTLR